MYSVSYVYPNVSGITQRGGLLERWQLAKDLGCDYIEIPADFIKNKTEVERTGLNLGDIITEEAIPKLYKKDAVIQNLKYILHTEPSLTRNDGYGISSRAPLKWYDETWVNEFIRMIISISEFFEIPPFVIEIHPGDKRNSFDNIAESITYLLGMYRSKFNVEPLVLLENRTGQFISNGKEFRDFWAFVSENYSQLKENIGIVLDIQQLFTVTKKNFLEELEIIPLEAVKGLHVHYKHQVPDLSNEIPWKNVFARISNIEHQLIINPEILHKNKVRDAIRFCEDLLNS